MNSEPVLCTNCATAIPGHCINIAALIAKCDLCGHIVRLDQPSSNKSVELPARPSGIILDKVREGELLSRTWYYPGLASQAVFCAIWDVFLLFWYFVAFTSVPFGKGFWGMVLFPLLHVTIGVVLTYSVVAGYRNRTFVSIVGSSLDVRHAPVPWWGQKTVPVADILEIELDRLPDKEPGEERDATISFHRVDGRKISLLSSIPERQAEYIGHVIAAAIDVPLVKHSQNLPPKDQPLDFKTAMERLKQKKLNG